MSRQGMSGLTFLAYFPFMFPVAFLCPVWYNTTLFLLQHDFDSLTYFTSTQSYACRCRSARPCARVFICVVMDSRTGMAAAKEPSLIPAHTSSFEASYSDRSP